VTRRCVGKPADWWTPDDDGARLAIALCRGCPALARCTTEDPHPHGVIRAAVPYSDDGQVLQLCPCGYPDLAYRGGARTVCGRCRTPDVPIPGAVDLRRRRVAALAARLTDQQIADQLGVSARTVRDDRVATRRLRQPGPKAVAR